MKSKQKRNRKGQFAKYRTLPTAVPFIIFFLLIFAGQVKALADSNTITYEKQINVTELTLIETTAESHNVQFHNLAVQIAIDRGLDVQKFTSTIACESNFNPTIQSNHIYNFDHEEIGIVSGEREKSYGIAQISIPHHNVTIEQAQDPVFALNWMADKWENGQAHLWSCYRQLNG